MGGHSGGGSPAQRNAPTIQARPTVRGLASAELVRPTWAADVVFPLALQLSIAAAVSLNCPRSVQIDDAEQLVSEGLLMWLRNDLRYKDLFA